MNAAYLQRLAMSDRPFALLYRPESGGGRVELLSGAVIEADELDDLDLDTGSSASPGDDGHTRLVLLPYRQVNERGFQCPDDGERLLAMDVEEQSSAPLDETLAMLPDTVPSLDDSDFDLDDDAYAAAVSRILEEEIGAGEGANFVLARSLRGQFAEFDGRHALAVFGRLLRCETGVYWTFLVYTGDRYLVGSSPEQHVGVAEDTVTMNPISGTYRYGSIPEGEDQDAGLLSFLHDPKEIGELSMVVDEELKMMAAVCDSGIRVSGPRLRRMSRLAHTEYVIEGRSSRPLTDILHHTLHAPTVTGSPVENACRVIARHEPRGRGYYSGIVGLVGRDGSGARRLDSAILIRTADIGPDGSLRLAAGSTIVRDSVPTGEAAETASKVAGLMGSLTPPPAPDQPAADNPGTTPAAAGRPGRPDTAVEQALRSRNEGLSTFWLRRSVEGDATSGPTGPRIDVLEAEDTFTTMIAYQLRSLGALVRIVPWHRSGEVLDATPPADLVVLGPGPGAPDDPDSPKMRTLRACARALLDAGRAVAGVCLGHQVLCAVLGLSLVRLPRANQGRRRVVELHGLRWSVGFYNSYAAFTDPTGDIAAAAAPDGRRVRMSRGDEGDVLALHGPGLSTMQFHPESFLTEHGPALLRAMIDEASGAVALDGEVFARADA